MKAQSLLTVVLCLAGAASCSESSPTGPGGGGGLAAPTPSAPADAAQLATLRPTLTVTNGTGGSGARTYEFQISDRSDFAPSSTTAPFAVSLSAANLPEGSGTTSFTPATDLQPATRMYWRARVSQGGSLSEWTPPRSFNTQIVGYSRPGELYDPLYGGTTIGTRVGATVFVPGRGIQLQNEEAHVYYLLPQTITSGEMSVEVEGLYANGPGGKLKIMSMFDGLGNHYNSKFLFNVQYRGLDGNPDNAVSFKALYGDGDWKYEPDFGQRSAGIRALNPAQTYVWRAIWGSAVRVVVQDGRGGPTLYDLSIPATEGTYAPNPHYVFIGIRRPIGDETGSWPNAIFRNFWVGTGPRPATLGTALSDARPF